MDKSFKKKINYLIEKKFYFKNLIDNKKYKSFFYKHNTCSDYFHLFVFIEKNIIKEIFYFGQGCSFSILGFEVLIPIFLNCNKKEYKFKKNEILKYFENKKYNSNIINKSNINFFSLANKFNLRLNCFLMLFNFNFVKNTL